MPTPTPRPNLPSLTAIAASNGALGVLALHALSLHDCIAALDARLAAVERDPLAVGERLASVERRLAAVEECGKGSRLVAVPSDTVKVGQMANFFRTSDAAARFTDGDLSPDLSPAKADDLTPDELKEWPYAVVYAPDEDGPADIAGFVRAQAARDAEIADLRAKLAGARTAYKMAEEHATQMRVERDAAEAKLTDLTRRRDAEQSCTAPSTCVHGVHLRDECDQCLAFNEGVAFGRRSAAVDMEALIAADAKVAALAADAARLTKPGPASDEELRRVYQRVDVTPGSGMRHDAGLRALYTYGLAHGRAEQAAAPAPDATDEEIAMAVDGYLRSHRGWGEGHGHRSDLTAAIATVVRPMLRAAEERAESEWKRANAAEARCREETDLGVRLGALEVGARAERDALRVRVATLLDEAAKFHDTLREAEERAARADACRLEAEKRWRDRGDENARLGAYLWKIRGLLGIAENNERSEVAALEDLIESHRVAVAERKEADARAARAEQERDEARDLAEQQYRVGRANAVDEMAKRAEWRKVNAGIEALAQCCNARERTDRICELRILIEQYAIDGRALAERAIAAAAQEIARLRTPAKVAAVVEAARAWWATHPQRPADGSPFSRDLWDAVDALRSDATPPPERAERYVAVTREEVRGRPASYHRDRDRAADYAAAHNEGRLRFCPSVVDAAPPEAICAVIDTARDAPPTPAPPPVPSGARRDGGSGSSAPGIGRGRNGETGRASGEAKVQRDGAELDSTALAGHVDGVDGLHTSSIAATSPTRKENLAPVPPPIVTLGRVGGKAEAPASPARAVADIAADVLACAMSWHADARLLGNVTAAEVATLARSCVEPAPIDAATLEEHARQAVGDFIYGHAKRISEQHDGCTDDETVRDFAAEVHDVLNNLRADENAEVYDGRPGRRVPTGPVAPPLAVAEPVPPTLKEDGR